MTRTKQSVHIGVILSKSYPLFKQTEVAFNQNKRIKRECFALKLAVYNRNEKMLRFLINGECSEIKIEDSTVTD